MSGRPTKQHGSDKVYQDENGLFFATAAIHQGRVTKVRQGPKTLDVTEARQMFNDALYRGIVVSDEEPETI